MGMPMPRPIIRLGTILKRKFDVGQFFRVIEISFDFDITVVCLTPIAYFFTDEPISYHKGEEWIDLCGLNDFMLIEY